MSKQLLVVSILVLLISACSSQITVLTPQVESTQPALQDIPTATATPLITVVTEQALPTLAFADTSSVGNVCPGAAAPHVLVGQQVTVVSDNLDKLKLRSEPKVSPDTIIRELDQSTLLKIVSGFVCVHSDETETSY